MSHDLTPPDDQAPVPSLKRPGGDDWIVSVLIRSEGEVYLVTVFGAADRDAAIRDALSSFILDDPEDLEAVGAECLTGEEGEDRAARSLAIAAEVVRQAKARGG